MKKLVAHLYKFGLIVLFFLVLSIPSVGYLFSGAGTFSESYFGRLSMVSAANQFRYWVLKDRMFTNLIANQNGWLMLTKDGLLDHQRNQPFTTKETRKIKDKLDSLCENLSEQNIFFVLFITPNKNTIYPEQIPSEIMIMDTPSNLDVVKNVWDETENCKFLDIRDKLISQKEKETVYHKTDTHWNSLGAFIGYRELMKLLAIRFPQIEPHERAEYQIRKYTNQGDMTRDYFSGLHVSEPGARLISKEKVDSFNKKWETKFSKREVFFTFSENKSLPSAIIYHDSFIYPMRPFMMDGFSETQQFRDELKLPAIDLEYIRREHPDIVILEITERFLRTLLQLPIGV